MPRRSAAVAAGDPQTAGAAAGVLRAGGNAFDAVVAAGFAAAVAEPLLTSLGAGGFLLASSPNTDPVLYDFFLDAPGRGRRAGALTPEFEPAELQFDEASQIFNAGWGSVAVPGCLDGYLHVHRQRGRLPLADVVAPAAELARRGAPVTAGGAEFLKILEPIYSRSSEGRDMFLPGGRRLTEGDTYTNPALGDVLDGIGAGTITGAAHWGGLLEEVMSARGGLITRADLEAYSVIERQPIALSYRDGSLWTNPAPSAGGTLVTEGLLTLARSAPHDGSPDAFLKLAEVLVTMSERKVADPHAVTGTTHVSVVDADGAVAAMTTSAGTGSGVFIPGTGIQLNNIMGEADLHPDGFHVTPPGVRIRSMLTPTVARTPDGTVYGLGSGGSERIRSAMTRVLVALLDEHKSLARAVDTARMHWDKEMLQVEAGHDPAVTDALAERWPINTWSKQHLYFGGVNAVQSGPTGVVAVGDARRSGSGIVVDLDE